MRRTKGRLAVEQLETRELPAVAFHFDFGALASPVAADHTAVPLFAYHAARGYGWNNTRSMGWRDRGTSDPLATDFHYGRDATFRVDLPNGTYDLTIHLGDAALPRDRMNLRVENRTLATRVATRAGEFTERSFRVQVDDGRLDLRIWDSGGRTASFALAGLDIKPVGALPTTGGPYATRAGAPLVFHASILEPSRNPGRGELTYAWDFGDGTAGQGPSPEHTYAEPGLFVVSLTVTDAAGDANTVRSTVHVKPRLADDALARMTLSRGWATFGQVLPQGMAYDALQLGELPTQTDVKTRWPDGSIRFAVVTAWVPAAGEYSLHAGLEAPGGLLLAPPDVEVRFATAGTLFSATLPKAAAESVWLSGSLVQEGRWTITPSAQDGTPHPFLRVLLDIRIYADGQTRLDVTVENVLNQAGATSATYDVDVAANGEVLFHRDQVTHYYLTRWRKVLGLGLEESRETFDFEPFYLAHALPRYLPLVMNEVSDPAGPRFDILGSADLDPYMPDHGGRAELAPYPDWAARYLVHQHPTQAAYVLANGDLAGSWPVHIRESDGRLVSIDERPNFWLDGRADPGDGPLGDWNATGPLVPDNAHQPSLAYIPYLLTGDRYYADEAAFWANYVLLSTFQDGFYNARGGSQGLLQENQVRGFAWGLRNLADAAAYLPDLEPMKEYFDTRVRNNLAWLDEYAARTQTPLGTFWEDKRPENTTRPPRVWIALWEQNYLAWAVDHANQQGFPGGDAYRDRVARLQLKLFGPGFRAEYGAPYVLAVGERGRSASRHYGTIEEVFENTHVQGGMERLPFQGFYGVDARLSLLLAIRSGWKGAREAHDWLFEQIALRDYLGGVSDLAARSGWAIALD